MTRAKERAAALRARFEAQGAQVVEPPILLPAETLLDLYGEDIRGRAYVTSDALRGEQMLRPDFTVPVVQMHMRHGAEPARYTYAGEVFRRQENDPDRANEYLQVGYEVFDRSDPASVDAEVYALIAGAVAGLHLRSATGDIGLLVAAVQGLRTTEARKTMLLRHVWRPHRFRALLDRFGGRSRGPAGPASGVEVDATLIGLRTQEEIKIRHAARAAEAQTAPISTGEMDALDTLLAVQETMPFALNHLNDLRGELPQITDAVERLGQRADALAVRGIDVDALQFEASYGRTSMEYYDGFVFGFYAANRPDLPPVASGGRYDALTRKLGQGETIQAVGGVLRPGLIVELEAEA